MSHASVDFFVLSSVLRCAYVSGYLLNQITKSIEKFSVIAAEYGNKVI